MKKVLKILTISFLPLILLCSCDRIIKNLTADQIHIMTVAYYETYVLGNETDQRTIDDIKRYEDLLKKAEKDGDTLALTVWEKYDDIGDWNIELEKGVFSFANEFLILAYRFRKNEFITVENAVSLNVISYDELKECFLKLNEYKGFMEV